MTADYLFTWKPGHWPYAELQRLVADFESGRPAVEPWRCQAHRKIRMYDRAYMMKLGDAPRGIFGVGTITGASYENPNASQGENAWLVPITFDYLVDPTKSILMSERELMKLDVPKHRWHPQGSGVTLETKAARAIDAILKRKRDKNIAAISTSERVATIQQKVQALISSDHLTEVMKTLARSIQIAHQLAPEKWGVRINNNSIMLKVGFTEVLQFGDGWAHFLVSNKLVPTDVRKDTRFDFSLTPYKNAPDCDSCDTNISNFEVSFASLTPAHQAAIQIATQSQIHTTTQRSHSTELIDLISDITKMALPQPAYVEMSERMFLYPDEQNVEAKFFEGEATRVLVNRYERDLAARNKCIEHHGTSCKVCGICFEDRYGPSVKGFIHVHHLAPLGDVRKQKAVDPVRDLQPVCPNCHAVIHSRKPPLSIKQVQLLIKPYRKSGES